MVHHNLAVQSIAKKQEVPNFLLFKPVMIPARSRADERGGAQFFSRKYDPFGHDNNRRRDKPHP